MPPENVSAFSLARSARPTRASISATRAFSAAPCKSVHVTDQHQVLFRRELDVDALLLEDHADLAANLAGLFGDVVAHDERAAAGGNHERREDAEGRGLAAAVGAEQSEDLGGANIERNARQGGAVAVLMAKVLQLNDGRLHVLLRPGSVLLFEVGYGCLGIHSASILCRAVEHHQRKQQRQVNDGRLQQMSRA